MLLTGLGRFVQDLLLWSTAEFGYLRLGDGFVQCSSIMPQKRNPVALEHARAIGSKALGQAQAIVTSVHNTPFGDIVDTEDDLQPLVFSMFRDATRAVKLVAAAMTTAEFDAQRLEARAGDGWTTLTELADTLVRDHDSAVQSRARDRGAHGQRRASRIPISRLSALLGRCVARQSSARRFTYSGAGARDHSQPAALRRSAKDTRGARRPRKPPARPRRRESSWTRDERWWTTAARSARRRRRAAEAEKRGPVTATYIKVLLIQAAIVLALVAFGRAFS